MCGRTSTCSAAGGGGLPRQRERQSLVRGVRPSVARRERRGELVAPWLSWWLGRANGGVVRHPPLPLAGWHTTRSGGAKPSQKNIYGKKVVCQGWHTTLAHNSHVSDILTAFTGTSPTGSGRHRVGEDVRGEVETLVGRV